MEEGIVASGCDDDDDDERLSPNGFRFAGYSFPEAR
jgi:hypothetical protein